MALIDALKGIALQLIVLHHLAFYGPMSDTALGLAPNLISWLYDYARIAVQVFLVAAGFLAARGLAPEGTLLTRQPLRLIGRRYLSLVLPFLAAILVAIAAAALARQLMHHESIPAAPTLFQFIAHALLIHGIGGSDSLSAGVWYVAIDFQLFILLVATLALARWNRNTKRPGQVFVIGLILASLFYFNRQAELDNWGFYFFGSYGMGALAYWASQQKNRWPWIAALLTIGGSALIFDYRLRLTVALLVAVLLATANRTALMTWPKNRLFTWLGRISYSVFLIHFPVILIVSALFQHFAPHSPMLNLCGMLLAWLLSSIAGAWFYTTVEIPLRSKY